MLVLLPRTLAMLTPNSSSSSRWACIRGDDAPSGPPSLVSVSTLVEMLSTPSTPAATRLPTFELLLSLTMDARTSLLAACDTGVICCSPAAKEGADASHRQSSSAADDAAADLDLRALK